MRPDAYRELRLVHHTRSLLVSRNTNTPQHVCYRQQYKHSVVSMWLTLCMVYHKVWTVWLTSGTHVDAWLEWGRDFEADQSFPWLVGAVMQVKVALWRLNSRYLTLSSRIMQHIAISTENWKHWCKRGCWTYLRVPLGCLHLYKPGK